MSSFLDKIKQRAKQQMKTIVLAEGEDIRTIVAADSLLCEGIANLIILGDENKIASLSQGMDISKATIINPAKSDMLQSLSNQFYEIRKSKGITPEQAAQTVSDPLYFGVMLVKTGKADGMVAGAVNSTPNVLRPGLQILKTAPDTKLVSAFFVMCVPDCQYGADGVFIFADSGLNDNPDADAVSEIAISSAHSFQQLVQQQARVAMLSYSTYGSAKGELVDKMQQATVIAKQKRPDLVLDGEFQLDAAIVPEVGKSKAPQSDVAGSANVLVFPNLDAGNIGYKLVQRLAKAEAYGPITQGIAKPLNDLSRGCTAEDIVGVVAITCVQAQK
ncbi:MAG: phosphate acetyltransferase [Clostridiaceae bacterium]|nr:phosphate acetyltransferase [Clostridiaceae bacterium]